jgi:hypothetical protein
MSDARRSLLEALLMLCRPLAEITAKLNRLGWDSSTEIIPLTRSNVVTILQRFLDREITAQEVEDWANAIEGREDLGLEQGHEDVLQQVLFELANPLITRSLNDDVASDWVMHLTSNRD